MLTDDDVSGKCIPAVQEALLVYYVAWNQTNCCWLRQQSWHDTTDPLPICFKSTQTETKSLHKKSQNCQNSTIKCRFELHRWTKAGPHILSGFVSHCSQICFPASMFGSPKAAQHRIPGLLPGLLHCVWSQLRSYLVRIWSSTSIACRICISICIWKHMGNPDEQNVDAAVAGESSSDPPWSSSKDAHLIPRSLPRSHTCSSIEVRSEERKVK